MVDKESLQGCPTVPLNYSYSSVDLMGVLAGCGQTAVLGCLYLYTKKFNFD